MDTQTPCYCSNRPFDSPWRTISGVPSSQSIKVLKTPLSDAKGLVDKKILNSETSLCQSSMDAMKADLKAVDKKIRELIDQDPVLEELFDIAECRPVDSVKGIGPVIATEVLITTNELKAAGDPDITDPKKYVCGWRSTYSGFAPFEHSSGQYKGKSRVSNKANKKVKALFHNGAMSAIQHCKELKEYRAANRYQRKVSEGKNEMLVINNVCNKLVHRIFACVSRREKYNENYIQTFA